MAILLRNFNRNYTVIRLPQFGAPRVASLELLELPRGSIFHYLPGDVTEIGPPQTLQVLERAEKLVQVRHVRELATDNIHGRPILIPTPLDRKILQYHRLNKKLRMMRDDSLITRDERTLLVENYALLPQRYRYRETLMSWYDRWHNLYVTIFNQMKEDTKKYDRQNYMFLQMPDVLPSIAQLRRAEKSKDQASLRTIRTDQALFFLDLWTWLGTERRRSLLSVLDEHELRRVNIVLVYKDKFVNLNLGELDFWRRKENNIGLVKPEQMQRRLYATAMRLATEAESQASKLVVEDNQEEIVEEENLEQNAENPKLEDTLDADEGDDGEDEDEAAVKIAPVEIDTALDPDPNAEGQFNEDDEGAIEAELAKYDDVEKLGIDEDAEFEIVKQPTDEQREDEVIDIYQVPTFESGIEKECQRFIDAGALTTREYERVKNQAVLYKSIPNPNGEGLLAEHITAKPEELKLVRKQILSDDPTIFDKTAAVSVGNDTTKQYIQKVLPKDINASVLSLQKAGYIVTDYNVEKIVDAANRVELHTVRVSTVKGEQSTLRFTIPTFDDHGYWTSNDITYTLRKQRVDLPIRKTAPDTVALTTFYGKNFVRRNEKNVHNATLWLTNQIVARGIDHNDQSITNVRFSNVFDPTVRLPKDYTSIATRLAGFESNGITYHFDHRNIEKNFGGELVKELKDKSLVPIAKKGEAVYAMDPTSMVYKQTAKGVEEVGTITDILNIDSSKRPYEFAELSLMGKAIPLAIIFSYYLGIERMLKLYKIPYRITESTERGNAATDDLVMKMSDCKLVIMPENSEQRMLLNGLRPYLKLTSAYTLRDFNQPDVYLNLIQKDGLSVRYLNELTLMDDLFIDPIADRMLQKMGEPRTFQGLLKRANEMLVFDDAPHETDAEHMHIFSHQRIAGAVYTEMVRSVREYRNKPGSRKKLEMHNQAVWQRITQDPAAAPSSDANPLHSVKEADVVTFGGNGGRSRRSMVKHTRAYTRSDLGIVSGDTVDNGDVGMTAYLCADPLFDDVDGILRKDIDRDNLTISQLMSNCTSIAPGAVFDDDKRNNFVGIQHGSGIAAEGYEVTGLRTGAEKLIAHRTGPTQANAAEADGKVVALEPTYITIQYGSGKDTYSKSYKLGRHFGRHEGSTFPHTLVTNLKLGQKVGASDIVTYNENFFEPDLFNPKQVNWKAGVMATVVLLEGTDTLEDSSAVSKRLAEKLRAPLTKTKYVTVRFDQAVHGLVKEGEEVTPETILCTIEDSLTANNEVFDDESLETLRSISAQVPKAKAGGVIDKIEVFYNGDKDEMSETIRAIANMGDRARKKEAAQSPDTMAETGRVDSSLRLDGKPVELDTLVIRIYITQRVPAVGGDKAVFANQMKSTFRRILAGKNRTVSGLELDAIFGKESIDARVVLSVYKIGTTNTLCRLISEHCRAILAKHG